MNQWIQFVQDWSKKHNKSYMCSVSDPECRKEYNEKYKASKTPQETAKPKLIPKPMMASKTITTNVEPSQALFAKQVQEQWKNNPEEAKNKLLAYLTKLRNTRIRVKTKK